MSLTLAPTATSLGLGAGDSPTFTNLTLSGNLTWTSGTSPAIGGVIDHANTSSTKTYTFPDASGNVALMGFANTGSLSASTTIHAGGIIDTDSTLKILGTGSTDGIFTCANATTDKTYTFPDATGLVPIMGFANTGSLSASTTIHAGGDIDTDTNLKFKSGTAFTLTLDHAIGADRTVTLPDAAGAIPIMGFANTGSLSASTTIHAGDDIDTDDNVKFKSGGSNFVILDHAASAERTVTFQDATGTVALTSQIPGSFGFVIDGGGSTITTGIKGDIIAPYSMTATEWTIVADQSGSIVIDVWKDTYANYPATVADTVTGSEKPTLSSATKNQDTSLSTPIVITAGDILRFNVDSVSTVTRVVLMYKGTRS